MYNTDSTNPEKVNAWSFTQSWLTVLFTSLISGRSAWSQSEISLVGSVVFRLVVSSFELSHLMCVHIFWISH